MQEEKNLSVEEIVERAFGYFDTFVARQKQLEGVLLEELEPQGEGWAVTIGFNGKRQETSEPSTGGALGTLAGFGSKTTKTVREIRRIYVDKEGRFEKMV